MQGLVYQLSTSYREARLIRGSSASDSGHYVNPLAPPALTGSVLVPVLGGSVVEPPTNTPLGSSNIVPPSPSGGSKRVPPEILPPQSCPLLYKWRPSPNSAAALLKAIALALLTASP